MIGLIWVFPFAICHWIYRAKRKIFAHSHLHLWRHICISYDRFWDRQNLKLFLLFVWFFLSQGQDVGEVSREEWKFLAVLGIISFLVSIAKPNVPRISWIKQKKKTKSFANLFFIPYKKKPRLSFHRKNFSSLRHVRRRLNCSRSNWSTDRTEGFSRRAAEPTTSIFSIYSFNFKNQNVHRA